MAERDGECKAYNVETFSLLASSARLSYPGAVMGVTTSAVEDLYYSEAAAPAIHVAGASVRRTLVVLPTFNEAGNLVALCEAILQDAPEVDILIVDDNSPDGTGALAKRLQAQCPGRVWAEVRETRSGRGDAVWYGLQFARTRGYAFGMEMDADFSHHPQAISQFLAAADDADLVIGSRHLPGGGVVGWSWRRRAVHRLASWFSDVVLGTPTTDHTNGFRLYRLSCLDSVALNGVAVRGFVGQTLRAYLFHRRGHRIREVPVVFYERRYGASKMSLREAIDGVWTLLWYRLRHHRE
ncbi:MAG: polyprenol monophosphomannose synthase [Deltaproteobacteria bacterium]|nr:polyprenol monophosphomannose synthase [Deltaproteobacteria bacterium]